MTQLQVTWKSKSCRAGTCSFRLDCDKRNNRKCISGAIFQAKVRQLAEKVYLSFPSDEQIKTQFRDRWLENFKQRWKLKSCKPHGKTGDVNERAIQPMLEKNHNNISIYAVKDVLNCDESGLLYQMAPDRTIAASSFLAKMLKKSVPPSERAASLMGPSDFC